MFLLSDGKTYVGKGPEKRMAESMLEHSAAKGNRPARTVLGSAHLPTEGNNELGKALEFKGMANEGAIAKSGKMPAQIPSTLDNRIVTGSKAYKGLNAADKTKVDNWAIELKAKMDADVKANAEMKAKGNVDH